MAAAAAAAQTVPESVEVKRPDGTVIQPRPPDPPDARDASQAQRATRAEELERRRADAQRSAEERVERSRAEREGAMQNPARQATPTTGR
ncbi:MAG TPA: hypothetical protein VKC64_15130 [Burkholderiales bacterium]|nr:hypothetical protein [Burkholderiales bacterium]